MYPAGDSGLSVIGRPPIICPPSGSSPQFLNEVIFLTAAEIARERMIQRSETEAQTASRHFRKSQEALRGELRKKADQRAARFVATDYSDRERRLADAIDRDLQQSGIRTKRTDELKHGGMTAAERARQRMIERMQGGGDE